MRGIPQRQQGPVAGEGERWQTPDFTAIRRVDFEQPDLLVVTKRVGYLPRSLAPSVASCTERPPVPHADMLGDLFGVPASGIRIINLQLTQWAL